MKTITWDTNFNGKMACNRFVHIDRAPEKLPDARTVQAAVFKIQTADRSHDPVMAKIENIVVFRLGEVGNIHTWPSHGMDSSDFIHLLHVKKGVHRDTELAIYYYKKVEQDVN